MTVDCRSSAQCAAQSHTHAAAPAPPASSTPSALASPARHPPYRPYASYCFTIGMVARLLWECNRKNSLPVDLEDELKLGLPDLPEVSVLWRRRLLQGSPQN